MALWWKGKLTLEYITDGYWWKQWEPKTTDQRARVNRRILSKCINIKFEDKKLKKETKNLAARSYLKYYNTRYANIVISTNKSTTWQVYNNFFTLIITFFKNLWSNLIKKVNYNTIDNIWLKQTKNIIQNKKIFLRNCIILVSLLITALLKECMAVGTRCKQKILLGLFHTAWITLTRYDAATQQEFFCQGIFC